MGRKVGFQNDYGIEREGKLAVEQFGLIDLSANACLFVVQFQVFLVEKIESPPQELLDILGSVVVP